MHIIIMSIEINLKILPTIYKNVECIEFANTKLLNGFVNNKLGRRFDIEPRDVDKFKIYDAEHNQILAYMKNKKTNKKNSYIVSHDLPSHNYGRVTPKDYLSLSIMTRKTRHALCKGRYVDIDMANCHSNIYLHIAKQHNLNHNKLQKYCDNPKLIRDNIIKTHFPNNTFSESDKKAYGKNLIISLSNGGSYTTWKKKHNIDIDNNMFFIKKYEIELEAIRNLIYENNPQICKDIIKNDSKHFKKYENDEINLINAKKRTTMALFGQTIERQIQEEAIKYLVDKHNLELKYIVPCQDGFMILKTKFKNEMVDLINEHIETELNINIEFVIKEFDEAIDIPEEEYLKEEYLLSDLEKYYNMDELLYTEIHQRTLDISYNDFLNNDTLIIKSGTGTGKTNLIASLCKDYKLHHPEHKILCLSNLTTILDQMSETFKKYGIDLYDYRTVSSKPGVFVKKMIYDNIIGDDIEINININTDQAKIINNDSFICINSLWKLYESNFKKTILIIDEPNNVLFNLTSNQTMNRSKVIINTFLQMFKKCHKVILLDAHYNKSIEELINMRKKTYKYYINTYKKFENHKAIKINDYEMVNKLKSKLDNNEKFIFASDSKSKLEGMYNILYEYSNEVMKQKFNIITADTETNITDLDYNDSIIFISPKVVCGVSIITEVNLDSFIYIVGESISPIALYQQATRLRTMNNLYYCDTTEVKINNYKSYEDCERKVINLMLNYETIINNSTYCTKQGDLKIEANYYFKLHVQNEYLKSINHEDMITLFENELIIAGFILKDESKYKNILSDVIKVEKEVYLEKQIIKTSDQLGDIMEDDENKTSYLLKCEYLNITTPEQLELYKEFVKYDTQKELFITVSRLFRTVEYIDEKIETNTTKRHQADLKQSPYYKVKMLKLYEKMFNIQSMNLYEMAEYKKLDKADEKLLNNILLYFTDKDFKPKIPNTQLLVYQLYGKLIKKICSSGHFLETHQYKIDGKNNRRLKYNENLINIIKLLKLKYTTFDNFDNNIILMLEKHTKLILIDPIECPEINYLIND